MILIICLGLRLIVGLFNIIIWGLCIKVWVILIFCLYFFDSFLINFLCLFNKLYFCIVKFILEECFFVGICLILVIKNKNFFIVIFGYKGGIFGK